MNVLRQTTELTFGDAGTDTLRAEAQATVVSLACPHLQ
jgi:hypothetical protein